MLRHCILNINMAVSSTTYWLTYVLSCVINWKQYVHVCTYVHCAYLYAYIRMYMDVRKGPCPEHFMTRPQNYSFPHLYGVKSSLKKIV